MHRNASTRRRFPSSAAPVPGTSSTRIMAWVSFAEPSTRATSSRRRSAIPAMPTCSFASWTDAPARVSALKSVVLPDRGRPTIPTFESHVALGRATEPKPTRASRAYRLTYSTRPSTTRNTPSSPRSSHTVSSRARRAASSASASSQATRTRARRRRGSRSRCGVPLRSQPRVTSSVSTPCTASGWMNATWRPYRPGRGSRSTSCTPSLRAGRARHEDHRPRAPRGACPVRAGRETSHRRVVTQWREQLDPTPADVQRAASAPCDAIVSRASTAAPSSRSYVETASSRSATATPMW